MEKTFFEKYIDDVTHGDARTRASVEAILARTDEILNDREAGKTRVSGLVVGRVQSGKTRNYTGLALKAADEGWNVILVLTSPITALAQQTQDRLCNDFKKSGVTDSTSKRLNFLGTGEIDEPTALGARHYFYWGVAMKEKTCLKRVTTWLDDNRRLGRQMRVLVIDDEADNATPDSSGVKGIPLDEDEIAVQIDAMRAVEGKDFSSLADWFAALQTREWTEDEEASLAHLRAHIADLKFDDILANGTYRRLLGLVDVEILHLVKAYFNGKGSGKGNRSPKAFCKLLQSILKVAEERSTINRAICSIVGSKDYSFARLAYIGYTATPYACILNERPGMTPLYADFIASLEKSPRYFGLEAVFGPYPAASKDEDEKKRPRMNIVRAITEEERKNFLVPLEASSEKEKKKETSGKKKTSGGASPDLKHVLLDDLSFVRKGSEVAWESLRDAVAWAFCTAAARRWIFSGTADKKLEQRWTTMLMNVSQKSAVHEKQKQLLDRYLTSSLKTEARRAAFRRRCKAVWERETARFTIEQFNALFNANPDHDENYGACESAYLAWARVEANLDYFMDAKKERWHIVILNSGHKDHQDIYLQTKKPLLEGEHLWFVLGGNTISRGLTLHGLTTSYFDRVRKSVAVDTMTQMGRWFGYREGYELLPRIWMTAETIVEMKRAALVEKRMHESIKENFEAKFSPSDAAHYQQIYCWGRRLSGRDACQRDLSVGSGTQGTIREFPRDPSRKREIFETVCRFLRDHEDWQERDRPKGKGIRDYLYADNPLWTGIQAARVRELMEELLPLYPSSSKLVLNGLIHEIDEDSAKTPWDVVLAIPEKEESAPRFPLRPDVPGVRGPVPANTPTLVETKDSVKGSTNIYVQYNANIRNEFLYREDIRVLVEKGGKAVISKVIAHLEAEAEKTGDKKIEKQLEKIDTALSPFTGRTRHERLERLCKELSDAAKSGCPHSIPNAVRVLWRHTEMGGYYDRHSPDYMEAVHEGAGKLNPMLMINLLTWKDARDGDFPFVALSLYWPKHAPNTFHAVSVGLEDVVTAKAPVADTPPRTKAASVEKVPSAEMPEIKIGKLAQAAFPVLFGEGKVTADDVAYLCSKAAEKDFKSRSNQVLKETTGDIEKDACDALGRKRFYAKIVLPFEGKKYLLTSQWYKKGLPNLLSWLVAHGLPSNRIKALCGADAVGKRGGASSKCKLIDKV